jgi:cyclophilin family peptidyl-prolyl cis-trans isomerase
MEERRKGALVAAATLAALAVAAFATIAAGCGGGGDSTTVSASGCKEVDAPEPKEVHLSAPEQTVQAGEELTAVVQTSCGRFTIALDSRRAPKIVNSFVYLAEQGFYDGLDFNRVVSGFVIQGGDPQRNGSSGPGYKVVEPPPPSTEYTRGVVAMAKSLEEPSGSAGSQFFVVTSRDTGYPPEYALLGSVNEGYGVVDRINKLGTRAEVPKEPVLIEKITIERG